MDLSELTVRPIAPDEDERYQQLLEQHHSLGAIPKDRLGRTAAVRVAQASRLRRFAIRELNLHAKPADSIASMTRRLAAKNRLVFAYLLMTKNSTSHAAVA